MYTCKGSIVSKSLLEHDWPSIVLLLQFHCFDGVNCIWVRSRPKEINTFRRFGKCESWKMLRRVCQPAQFLFRTGKHKYSKVSDDVFAYDTLQSGEASRNTVSSIFYSFGLGNFTEDLHLRTGVDLRELTWLGFWSVAFCRSMCLFGVPSHKTPFCSFRLEAQCLTLWEQKHMSNRRNVLLTQTGWQLWVTGIYDVFHPVLKYFQQGYCAYIWMICRVTFSEGLCLINDWCVFIFVLQGQSYWWLLRAGQHVHVNPDTPWVVSKLSEFCWIFNPNQCVYFTFQAGLNEPSWRWSVSLWSDSRTTHLRLYGRGSKQGCQRLGVW